MFILYIPVKFYVYIQRRFDIIPIHFQKMGFMMRKTASLNFRTPEKHRLKANWY